MKCRKRTSYPWWVRPRAAYVAASERWRGRRNDSPPHSTEPCPEPALWPVRPKHCGDAVRKTPVPIGPIVTRIPRSRSRRHAKGSFRRPFGKGWFCERAHHIRPRGRGARRALPSTPPDLDRLLACCSRHRRPSFLTHQLTEHGRDGPLRSSVSNQGTLHRPGPQLVEGPLDIETGDVHRAAPLMRLAKSCTKCTGDLHGQTAFHAPGLQRDGLRRAAAHPWSRAHRCRTWTSCCRNQAAAKLAGTPETSTAWECPGAPTWPRRGCHPCGRGGRPATRSQRSSYTAESARGPREANISAEMLSQTKDPSHLKPDLDRLLVREGQRGARAHTIRARARATCRALPPGNANSLRRQRLGKRELAPQMRGHEAPPPSRLAPPLPPSHPSRPTSRGAPAPAAPLFGTHGQIQSGKSLS